MTNQILDEDFTPITVENLQFKGTLYAKKLKYDKRVEYLQKMRVLMFVVPIFFIIPMLIAFAQINFDIYYLAETLIITGFFCLAGALFNKNPLVTLITVSVLLILFIILQLFAGILPFRHIAILLLILIGIGVYFNGKSLEKELVAAYKAGHENAYLKS